MHSWCILVLNMMMFYFTAAAIWIITSLFIIFMYSKVENAYVLECTYLNQTQTVSIAPKKSSLTSGSVKSLISFKKLVEFETSSSSWGFGVGVGTGLIVVVMASSSVPFKLLPLEIIW